MQKGCIAPKYLCIVNKKYSLKLIDMSFEDNMIDDGFNNEMDYMDYLMVKACEDDNDDFGGNYHHKEDDEDLDEND